MSRSSSYRSNSNDTRSQEGDQAHMQEARMNLEKEVMGVLTNEEIKFTKSVVFGQTHSHSFRYESQEGKFMSLDYNNESIVVTHNFEGNVERTEESTKGLRGDVDSFHNFVFNMFDPGSSYWVDLKVKLFKRMSMQYFKCIYEHSEEILEDIRNLNKSWI
jgi:hypothetical protein